MSETCWKPETNASARRSTFYIEELEERLKRVQEGMDEFLLQVRNSDARASKLEAQLNRMRMTATGRVVHCPPNCQHVGVLTGRRSDTIL